MSNYAYLITERSNILSESFIKLFNPESLDIKYNGDYIVYTFSKNIEKCQFENGFFKGYYIDHDNKKLGFISQKNIYKSFYEGCFISIINNEPFSTKISADVFGIMPMLYSVTDKFIIVSDSLYFIKKLRQNLGYSISLDYENFISRTYINALTSQPLSSSTLIKEIKYALPGSILSIDFKQSLKFDIEHIGAKEIYKLEKLSYEDIVRKASRQLCGLLGGIVNSEKFSCSFDLTGGLDSRLVLSGASYFFSTDKLRVGSHIGSKSDYAIASKICRKLDLPLNIKAITNYEKVNAGAIWMVGNAGIYDSLYATTSKKLIDENFNIGGHGAEVFKGNYGFRKVSEIGTRYENEEIYNLLQIQLKKGLKEFGIDSENKVGSEWHFLAFRNAIHSSRGLQLSNFYLRPLLMKTLVHNIKELPRKNKFKENLVSDMLIYINPELAQVEFDDVRKNITCEDIDRVQKTIGQYKFDEDQFYNIEGKPNKFSSGYLEEVLEMAEKDGFSDKLTHSNFVNYINTEVLPKDKLAVYSINYLFNYIYGVKENGKPATLNQKAIAMAKLLSLNLFNN